MRTESITSWSKALPLNLPADCAVTTVPPTFVPTGKTTRLPLVRGTASEAAKGSPLFAVCEFTVWSSVTVIVVPAGITTGGSGGGGAGAAAAGAVAGAAALLADEFGVDDELGFAEFAALPASGVVAGLLPHSAAMVKNNDNARN